MGRLSQTRHRPPARPESLASEGSRPMTTWNPSDIRALTSPQEVQVVTRRPDGTLRSPRTIWIVGDGDKVFIRSTNGPGADWYCSAVAAGTGQILAGAAAYEVRFVKAGDEDLPLADRAYRTKYGHDASIVDHLNQPGPRSATGSAAGLEEGLTRCARWRRPLPGPHPVRPHPRGDLVEAAKESAMALSTPSRGAIRRPRAGPRTDRRPAVLETGKVYFLLAMSRWVSQRQPPVHRGRCSASSISTPPVVVHDASTPDPKG